MRSRNHSTLLRFLCLAATILFLSSSSFRKVGHDLRRSKLPDSIIPVQSAVPCAQVSDTALSIQQDHHYVPAKKLLVRATENHHIPAIIIPVLWEYDLLSKSIWSIDVPVKKIILIVNHLRLPSRYVSEIESMAKLKNFTGLLEREIPNDFLQVVYLKENLGFAKSMNLGMKIVRSWASWWLCANADIIYTPGALGSVLPVIWGDHGNGTMLYMLGHGFSAIALTQHLLSRVGFFDEHIWPAYVEDCDLMLRVRLVAGDLPLHSDQGGESGKYFYLQPTPGLEHVGGQGRGSEDGFRFASKIQEAHKNNVEYYLKKWGLSALHWEKGAGVHRHGCGIPMTRQFTLPFNMSAPDEWNSLPFVIDHDRRQENVFLVDRKL